MARKSVARRHRLITGSYAEQLTVRDLLPRDLGLNNWVIPAGTRNWVHHKEDATIILYNVLNLSPDPTITELEIKMGPTGATTLGIINIERCYSILPIIKNLGQLSSSEIRELLWSFTYRMEGYFKDPYLFDINQIININTIARANEENHLLIGGYVCEEL